MKKKIAFAWIAACCCFLLAGAQESQSFDVDGIKVIHKQTSKNVIDVRIYFRGGVTNYPANKAGIENITLAAALRCGSANYSTKAVKDTSDNYGIELSGFSGYDSGCLELNCISRYFNQGWGLFTDAVMSPAFDARELELVKNEIIGFHKEFLANPDNHLEILQRQNAFSGTPYAVDPTGSEESLSGLTSEDAAAYYKSVFSKNRIFIVVVGNIGKQDLYEKILSAFDNIPSRPYTPAELQTPVLKGNTLAAQSSNLATNYLGAAMNAPEYTNIYFVPFRIGMAGIGGNLFQYLQTERNLSGSQGSTIYFNKMPYATIYAGTTDPVATMPGMLKVLKDVQSAGLNQEWLQHIKNTFLTSSYINDQSSSAIAANLGVAEVLGGWQYADDLPKLVEMVTVDQVNTALSMYIVGLKWTYLGNTGAIEGLKPPVY